MDFLQVWVGFVFRSTDPDLEGNDVIPGPEKPGGPGIIRALGKSVREEYRA